MIPSDQAISIGDDEINLIELWRTIWGRKYFIVLIVLLFVFVAAYLALTAVPIFRAEVVVTEVSESSMSAGAALASQFGGLASLAGINVSEGGGREAQAVLTSRHLVEEFVKRNNLGIELFPDAKKPPSLWRSVKQFQEKVISVKEDRRSGTTRVAVSWNDPVKCALWANGIVSLANELIRTRALEDANRNIAYLNSQLAKTNVVEIQNVMYKLIESETKTLMLANAKADYAFSVIDPAVAPEIRISPKRTLMVFVGAVLGLFFALAMVFTQKAIDGYRQNVSR